MPVALWGPGTPSNSPRLYPFLIPHAVTPCGVGGFVVYVHGQVDMKVAASVALNYDNDELNSDSQCILIYATYTICTFCSATAIHAKSKLYSHIVTSLQFHQILRPLRLQRLADGG
jgi:hypothetical protein